MVCLDFLYITYNETTRRQPEDGEDTEWVLKIFPRDVEDISWAFSMFFFKYSIILYY
jgi:hypothetical protein